MYDALLEAVNDLKRTTLELMEYQAESRGLYQFLPTQPLNEDK